MEPDERLIRRVIHGTHKRLAGHRWVSNIDKDIQQLRTLGANPAEFYIHEQPFTCKPRNADFGDWKNEPTKYSNQKHLSHRGSALIKSSEEQYETAQEEYCWYQDVADRLDNLLSLGQVTEEQVRRLTKLMCR